MRRRLVMVGLATALLIVISLIVPLGLLVRRQAADRARVATEREAQSAAGLIALAVTLEDNANAIASTVDRFGPGLMVVLDDGRVFGEPLSGQGTLIRSAGLEQATVTAVVDGGWEIALPVIGPGGVAVVDAFATDDELTDGVMEAWALLFALGVLLVGLSVSVADRLGKRMVEPMRELAGAAHLMSEGDLEARVRPQVMVDAAEEIVEVGEAFNTLAFRLDQLLVEEREAVADLSHRLRTPLTSLRLQAEKIADVEDRKNTLAQVDRLEEAIDSLIQASRSRAGESGKCRLDAVAADRCSFWAVLAEEEGRLLHQHLGAGLAEVSVPAEEIGVVIDALMGNVFSHTPPGTDFGIRTGDENNRLWLEIYDDGEGFSDSSAVARGTSGRGSTGLGLDIVRRTAEKTGGTVQLSERTSGGALVRVWFG